MDVLGDYVLKNNIIIVAHLFYENSYPFKMLKSYAAQSVVLII